MRIFSGLIFLLCAGVCVATIARRPAKWPPPAPTWPRRRPGGRGRAAAAPPGEGRKGLADAQDAAFLRRTAYGTGPHRRSGGRDGGRRRAAASNAARRRSTTPASWCEPAWPRRLRWKPFPGRRGAGGRNAAWPSRAPPLVRETDANGQCRGAARRPGWRRILRGESSRTGRQLSGDGVFTTPLSPEWRWLSSEHFGKAAAGERDGRDGGASRHGLRPSRPRGRGPPSRSRPKACGCASISTTITSRFSPSARR